VDTKSRQHGSCIDMYHRYSVHGRRVQGGHAVFHPRHMVVKRARTSILQRQSKRTTEGAVNARTCVWHAARSGEEKGVGAVAALALALAWAHGSG
jgi:hypothetical protein